MQAAPMEANPGMLLEMWNQFQEFQAFKALMKHHNSQQASAPIQQPQKSPTSIPLQNGITESMRLPTSLSRNNLETPPTTPPNAEEVGEHREPKVIDPKTPPAVTSCVQQELVIEKEIDLKADQPLITTTISVQEVAGPETPAVESHTQIPTPQSFSAPNETIPLPAAEVLPQRPTLQSFSALKETISSPTAEVLPQIPTPRSFSTPMEIIPSPAAEVLPQRPTLSAPKDTIPSPAAEVLLQIPAPQLFSAPMETIPLPAAVKVSSFL